VESNGSSGYLFCIVLLGKSDRRQIAQSRLLSNAVVKDFNVFGDFLFGLLTGEETLMMDQFVFQGAPEATFRTDSFRSILNGKKAIKRLV